MDLLVDLGVVAALLKDVQTHERQERAANDNFVQVRGDVHVQDRAAPVTTNVQVVGNVVHRRHHRVPGAYFFRGVAQIKRTQLAPHQRIHTILTVHERRRLNPLLRTHDPVRMKITQLRDHERQNEER